MMTNKKPTEAEKLEMLEKELKDLRKKIDRKKEERLRKAGLILEQLPDRFSSEEGVEILSRRLQQSAKWLDANPHMKGSPAYKLVKEVRSHDATIYRLMKSFECGQIEYYSGPGTMITGNKRRLRRP